MLDLADFVTERGGDLKKIKESQRKRFAPEETVDEVVALYEEARRARYEVTQMGSQINGVQKAIGMKKKNKEDATELLAQKAELEAKKKELEETAVAKEVQRDRKIRTIGNYVHESVPVSNDEADNKLIKTWTPENAEMQKPGCLSHHEVLTRLDGYDPERGVKIVGHRGYCLTGYGLFLNLALVNYGLEFLFNKGYTPNQPPQFMLKDLMAKTAQLEQFDEELYKVTESEDKSTDKYLIATSEQPLSALHDSEWLQDKDLPIKYAGYSTCYRKEAGSHGKDAWGIFRVHQFEKIEQFVLTKPEDSWQAFEDMISTSEEFYQSLKLPYNIVAIVSGALNNAASKKYDLEAWFPFQQEYKELVSCSNCTDYQSRALEIRYGVKKATDIKKTYVHALNSTLCATERTLCCLLENYQKEDGIEVPEVLRKYIPGAPEFLPYTKELPKDSTSTKAKGKATKGTDDATKKMQGLQV
ncbi:Aminoacyl-tRNA synthetase class II [Penicillium cf. griseofulvum]|uniref:serine--tRNA ligase n=1 Tax=Penicillium cf. griseofulvum TaxID=2972120 RepID=A0A9W9MB28_9EURO|nr:Aminoacyl-tRNA synthetase class II [Penicillium cf. griseofulvum]KAJ5444996.1 Aminoacyl-tRNA synthetase class II [Penicillium cf. griseofulvum]KAJ5446710.1 Aminoacyl-tRNA synthetase class II [Penicillium cf. griseofulvum]